MTKAKKVKKLTDLEIKEAFMNTDFGGMSNHDVLKHGLLKCVCGYYQGSTSTAILHELKLITKKYEPTKRGLYHLWEWFNDNSKI